MDPNLNVNVVTEYIRYIENGNSGRAEKRFLAFQNKDSF